MPKYAIDAKPDGSERRIVEADDFAKAAAQAKPGEIVGLYPDNVTETPLNPPAAPSSEGSN